MAKCPHCGYNLKIWDVKAECPKCDVNIPNYKWEERLNEDAEIAQACLDKLHLSLKNFLSALFGTKFRIIRFIMTFVPLVALFLPFATVTVSLPFAGDGFKISLFDFILNYLTKLDFGATLELCKSQLLGSAVTGFFIGVVLPLVAYLFGVLNFFFMLIGARRLSAISNIVLCALSSVCFAGVAVALQICSSQLEGLSLPFFNADMQYGFFVGLALFVVNLLINIFANIDLKKEKIKHGEEDDKLEQEK